MSKTVEIVKEWIDFESIASSGIFGRFFAEIFYHQNKASTIVLMVHPVCLIISKFIP